MQDPAPVKAEKRPTDAEHESHDNGQNTFFASLMFFQILILIIFAAKCDYPNGANNAKEIELYPMFQDVHVMIFIGFGFLMTFLRKYGYGAIGLNMMIAAITLQWQMTVGESIHQAMAGHSGDKIFLTPETLVKGDFAAGAVLISFGAVIGRVTPTQLTWMAMLEVLFYSVSEYLGAGELKAVDMGGSIFVHTFGAYFGLAVSWMMGAPEEDEEAQPSYRSDLFSMCGTIFLWMFWPSFNGALSDPTVAGSRQRILINTVLAISGSCVTTFAFSKWLGGGHFEMEHIQNATLAGGVAVGSSSDLVVGPWAAVLIGVIAGMISVVGYMYVSEWIQEKFGVWDTCGVHNLHGMPGIIGALGGAISASAAGTSSYGNNICTIFAGRCDANGVLLTTSRGTAAGQAWSQIGALAICLAISISCGMLTGSFLKAAFPAHKSEFQDHAHWEVPADYAFTGEEKRPLVRVNSNNKIVDPEEVEMGDMEV